MFTKIPLKLAQHFGNVFGFSLLLALQFAIRFKNIFAMLCVFFFSRSSSLTYLPPCTRTCTNKIATTIIAATTAQVANGNPQSAYSFWEVWGVECQFFVYLFTFFLSLNTFSMSELCLYVPLLGNSIPYFHCAELDLITLLLIVNCLSWIELNFYLHHNFTTPLHRFGCFHLSIVDFCTTHKSLCCVVW